MQDRETPGGRKNRRETKGGEKSEVRTGKEAGESDVKKMVERKVRE